MNALKFGLSGGFALLAAVCPATAQELKIGVQTETTAIDPHYNNGGANNQLNVHLYEALLTADPKGDLVPRLAVSYKTVDDTTWEFKLRPGVKFHDGSAFGADDVVCSFKRAQTTPAAAGGAPSFGPNVVGKTVAKVDDLTVQIKTKDPAPLMPFDVAAILIVSAKSGCNASTADFNSGKAAIGTGPFSFAEYVPGDRVVMNRNEAYWGPKPAWTKVTLKPIPSDAARSAALAAGTVDFIDAVPPAEIAKLKANPNVELFQVPSTFVILLALDQWRENSPQVKGNDGQPIKNPLLDRRVRLAISKAIDRNAIKALVMDGLAEPAGQLVPKGMYGYSEKLKPEAFDPAGASRLLAEAGLPNGFRLTLAGTNDRYVNDAQVMQAVARMLTDIGIKTVVEAMPFNTFATRRSATKPGGSDFSFFMTGRSGTEATGYYRFEVASINNETGFGTSNGGGYSSKKLDTALGRALATIDDKKRDDLLIEVGEIAADDVGVIPLHWQVYAWAARKGLSYSPYVNQRTAAFAVTPSR